MAEPDICRGGPWSNHTLSDGQKDELQAALRCRTLYALNELAEFNQRGSLYRHLKELQFVKPAAALSSEIAVCRYKRKTSGISRPCDSQYLKSAVRAGALNKPSARFARLKRGIDYRARRVT